MTTKTDLEAQERANDAEVAFGIEQRVRGALSKGREAMWELAESLCEFDEARGWLALSYDTLNEWLAQPEIGLKQSTYYSYVQVWRELVTNRGVDFRTFGKTDISKAQIVLPAIRANKVLLKDALADAEALGARDLREKYYGSKPEPKDDDPDDDNPATTPDDSDQLDAEWDLHEPVVGAEIEVLDAEPAELDDIEDDLDLPNWMTEDAVAHARAELSNVIELGAQFPRVSHRTLQIAQAHWDREVALRDVAREFLRNSSFHSVC